MLYYDAINWSSNAIYFQLVSTKFPLEGVLIWINWLFSGCQTRNELNTKIWDTNRRFESYLLRKSLSHYRWLLFFPQN